MNRMSGIIFSNIYDGELGELTSKRTVASLPFGGRYRQIDFTLSSMANSNITSVGVITKYNYSSLMNHLGSSDEWDLNRKNGGIYIIPPFASGRSDVYHGKLDALHSAMNFLKSQKTEYIVLSDTIAICNIDYKEVLNSHIKSKKDITAVAIKPQNDDTYPAVYELNDIGETKAIGINSKAKENQLAGFGMYIIERERLMKEVSECVNAGFYHFEKDFLQKFFNDRKLYVNVYEFKGVVLRNRDISSYLENNLKLVCEATRKDLFKASSPVYTRVHDELPTYYGDNSVTNECIVADGCEINGVIENSVLFRGVKVFEGAKIIGSVIMQGSKIGKDAYIENAIIDKNVTVSDGTRLIGAKNSPVIVGKGETI